MNTFSKGKLLYIINISFIKIINYFLVLKVHLAISFLFIIFALCLR